MVDLQTEALIAIAVIGIALVSFGLYPIAKLALRRTSARTLKPPRKPACEYEME